MQWGNPAIYDCHIENDVNLRYMGEIIHIITLQSVIKIKPCVTCVFNTLRPKQDGRHFADDIFKRIFLNDNSCISIDI